MVSATNIEAIIPYRPPKPEPEIPWWTVSYPWISRPEDSLWVLIKSSEGKRRSWTIGIEPDWRNTRKTMDTADTTRDPEKYDKAIETLTKNLEKYINSYEYGSDPVMDAYLADYGMSTDPDNPLSFWNPCYVMFHLFYIDITFCY